MTSETASSEPTDVVEPGDTTRKLTALLVVGETAAFSGPPAPGVPALEQALRLATAEGLEREAGVASWLLGVVHAAAGRYGQAIAMLEPLVSRAAQALDDTSPDAVAPRQTGALAATALGAIHRELGRHAEARGYDQRGLAFAGDDITSRTEALLGLVADAVGMGDRAAAEEMLVSATSAVAEGPPRWRADLRLCWVRAELAQLAGDQETAMRLAGEALALAEDGSSPRQVARSALFLGATSVGAGHREEAVASLHRAATLAEGLGALPLQWPARALLGALLIRVDQDQAMQSLAAAGHVVRRVGEDLPVALREQWYARQDVTALLAAANSST